MTIDVEVKKPKTITVEMSNVRINQNEPNLQSKSVTYTENGTYEITADEGYDGLDRACIDVDVPQPSGSLDITENGSVDVTEYATAEVNVQPELQEKAATYTENGTYTVSPDVGKDGLSEVEIIVDVPEPPEPQLQDKTFTENGSYTADSGYTGFGTVTVNVPAPPEPQYQSKTITPSTSQQTVTSDEGYDALSAVLVNAVTADIDSDITAANIKKDVEILGVIGTYEGAADTRFDALIDGSLSGDIVSNATKIKGSAFAKCPITSFTGNSLLTIKSQAFVECLRLTSFISPLVTTTGYGSFQNTILLTKFDCVATSIDATAFRWSGINQLVLRGSTVCTLANVNAFTGTQIASGTGYIYVPDALVNSYKSATNWSTYAAQIRGLSQLPTI